MRDLAATVLSWLDEGHRLALATVVAANGSSPRGPGSAMAVRDDGLIWGSVSGGCVEGAVVEAGLRSLETGKPERLEFGPESDASLFEVGLSCGGSISVWVEPVLDAVLHRRFFEALLQGKEAIRITRLEPDRYALGVRVGSEWLGDDELRDFAQAEESGVARVLQTESGELLIDPFPAPRRLILVGAVHVAIPLAAFAKSLGFEVTVVDPRATFARVDRFAIAPDRLMQAWPREAFEELGVGPADAVATLSHDGKIDDPALLQALKAGCWYVGALGSAKTQAKKRERLLEMGATEADMDRIHGPIGLDIAAKTPEEIALSILAEIVAARAGQAPA